MAILHMKLESEKYEIDIDKLTLGEACTLEEDFGVPSQDEVNIFKATHLRGLFFIAVTRKHPELPAPEIRAKVDAGVTAEVFNDLRKQIEAAIAKAKADEENPQKPVAADAKANGHGGSVTTRKTPGTRRTPVSTA